MENPISISLLNDFIFCPVSIYFHLIDDSNNSILTKEKRQIAGDHAHKCVDEGNYTTRKDVLQSRFVYCEKYNIIGKIDIFDVKKRILTERKNKINFIYDGYIFQLYAQYFALVEMGYDVREINLYSFVDNKTYRTDLPNDNPEMLRKFERLIEEISTFEIENYVQTNANKCENCIYEELCSFSVLKEGI